MPLFSIFTSKDRAKFIKDSLKYFFSNLGLQLLVGTSACIRYKTLAISQPLQQIHDNSFKVKLYNKD